MNVEHSTFNAQHPMVGRVTPCALQIEIREWSALVVEWFSRFCKSMTTKTTDRAMIQAMKTQFTVLTNAETQRSAEKEIHNFLCVSPRSRRLCVKLPMASLLLCVFALMPLGLRAATNDLTAALQKGLFEEEANRNLDAAISNYQALATQFDQDRQIAATAIFRLGECYRKLGQTNDAVVQYQRILREFSDQQTLATLSRENLTGLGAASQPHFEQRLQAIITKNPQDAMVPTSDGEDLDIRRIEQLIQNSPDLINAERGADAPLYAAAGKGQLRVAGFLLDHGANIEGINHHVPLLAAARNGNRAMVELLLSRGADVNAKENDGDTALHYAAGRGFQAVAEVLLANHADVNIPNTGGSTPLFLAASSGQLEIIQMLLAAGANTNLKDGKGRSPLNYAIGNAPEIFQALLDAGTNPNTEDPEGRTPLSYAAERDSSKVVRLLLAAKADPNAGKLDVPLLCAIHKQDVGSAELLLANGANPNLKGGMDWPVPFGVPVYSGANSRDRAAYTPLYLAVSTGQLPMVKLLLKCKADPNDSQTDGQSLLFSALSETNILEALLDAGAKVDAMGVSPNARVGNSAVNWTPLGEAARQNNAAAVETLFKHGANPNARDPIGNFSPLHWAANNLADRKVFDLLLAFKADQNVRDVSGQTPLDILKEKTKADNLTTDSAGKKKAGELADLLRQHGALDNLPHWDRIMVSRPSANFSQPVFQKGTNDWNRFTLLETILNYYESTQTYSVSQGNGTWVGYPANSMMPFPDLTHITVMRPNHNSTNAMRKTVNLLDSTNGIDCSKDLPLEFGDMVEIPEREHALGDASVGMTDSQRGAIAKCLEGSAQLVVRDQKVQLSLYPIPYYSLLGSVLNGSEAKKVLLSSSDLTRVKVTRHDPVTKKKHEWVINCATSPEAAPFGSSFSQRLQAITDRSRNDGQFGAGPDLWLRDGDVIEVPEK